MKTILVVDSSVSLFDFVKYSLYQEGFCILGATSEEEALSILKDQAIDLILLETSICLESGLYQVLNLDPQTKSIPIVFLTSNQDSSQEESLLLLSGQDYLMKPLQKLDLVFRVKRYLQVPHMTILCISISNSLKEQLSEILTPQAFQVISATKMEMILPLLQTYKPHIVLIDSSYSVGTLKEMIKLIKQNETISRLIMIMGLDEMVGPKGDLLSEIDDYVMKPILVKDLVLRMKKTGAQMKPLKISKAVVSEGAIQEAKEKLLQQIQVSLHHEIRSPLTSILIGSQALHKKFEEGTPERQVINGIETCSRRIKDVMDTLGSMKEFVEEDYAYGVKMISFSKSTQTTKPSFVANPLLVKQA